MTHVYIYTYIYMVMFLCYMPYLTAWWWYFVDRWSEATWWCIGYWIYCTHRHFDSGNPGSDHCRCTCVEEATPNKGLHQNCVGW